MGVETVEGSDIALESEKSGVVCLCMLVYVTSGVLVVLVCLIDMVAGGCCWFILSAHSWFCQLLVDCSLDEVCDWVFLVDEKARAECQSHSHCQDDQVLVSIITFKE